VPAVPFRLLLAFCLLAGAALASPAASAPPTTWYLTNHLAARTVDGNTYMGPHESMEPGAGNGAFPTGYILVRSGGPRTWVGPVAERKVVYMQGAWTLEVSSTSAATELAWTIGIWDWRASTFKSIGYRYTTGSGTSSLNLRGFTVQEGQSLALTIGSPTTAPSLIDVFNETGPNSPTHLTGPPTL
jgi:hypothetical protein